MASSKNGSRRPTTSPFVIPGIKRYTLWDDDPSDPNSMWIEIKERLNYGDEQEMAGKIIRSIQMDAGKSEDATRPSDQKVEMMLDVAIDGPFKILVWVQDWNLRDQEGKTVELTMESVQALDLEWADEINRVINDHEEATGQGKGRKKSKTA